MAGILVECCRDRQRARVVAVLVLALAGCDDKPVVLVARHGLATASRATPLVTASVVVLGHDRGITLAEPSGKLRCSVEVGGVEGRPALAGERIIAATLGARVVGLDAGCKVVWSVDVGDRVRADLAVALGRVLIASYDRHLYALLPGKGERAWTYPERGAPPLAGEVAGSGPVVHEGTIYLGDLAGWLYAIDATSGALRWRHHLGAGLSAPVVASPDAVIVGSDDGVLRSLSLPVAPGAEPVTRWQLRTEAARSPSACLADGTVYVASFDRHLYAVNAESGRLLWRAATRGPLLRAPVVTSDLVLVGAGSGDGSLYAFDRQSGAELWHHTTGGALVSEPVLAGSRLWLAGTDGSAYVFEVRPRPSPPAARAVAP
jgi:outer membrane protein assembly factor BamB